MIKFLLAVVLFLGGLWLNDEGLIYEKRGRASKAAYYRAISWLMILSAIVLSIHTIL